MPHTKTLSITIPTELYVKLMKIKKDKFINLSSWISTYIELLVKKEEEKEMLK